MIISSRPLIELVPVQPAAMAGRFICQWDKDSCDDARFIKIDFLALGMLSLVEECLELIWRSRGEKARPQHDRLRRRGRLRRDLRGRHRRPVPDREPRPDPDADRAPSRAPWTTWRSRSRSCARARSSAARSTRTSGGASGCARDPTYRPRADHPLLDELLRDTLGVVLYQDQVLEVAIEMGGFTPGQADQFRRAMSRRRSREAMERFRDAASSQGAVGKGVPEADGAGDLRQAARVLRVRLPEEPRLRVRRAGLPVGLAAALLPGRVLRRAAQQPADGLLRAARADRRRPAARPAGAARRRSTRSEVRCRAARRRRRSCSGLTTVRGLGEELAAGDRRRARGERRRTARCADLLRRDRPAAPGGRAPDRGRRAGRVRPEPARAALAARAAAAAATVGPQRARATPAARAGAADRAGHGRALPDMTDWERMVADYGLLGSRRATTRWRCCAATCRATSCAAEQVPRQRDGARVRTAGLVVCRQRPGTAKGFVFLLLEDETGLINVVIKPDLYEAAAQRHSRRAVPVRRGHRPACARARST